VKKFKFRLETVAKVRRIEMEQQAKVLALIFQQIAQVKVQIEEFKQLAKEEILRVQTLSNLGNFTDQMVLVSLNYREGLKRKVIAKLKEIEALELRAEQEKVILIEKTKRKKVIEKLEEREKEQYELETRKTETKDMDEIAGILRDHHPK
jgi:flagellar FliJ protein